MKEIEGEKKRARETKREREREREYLVNDNSTAALKRDVRSKKRSKTFNGLSQDIKRW
jgi:hypothetical protein